MFGKSVFPDRVGGVAPRQVPGGRRSFAGGGQVGVTRPEQGT